MSLNEYQFHVVAPGYQAKKNGGTGSKTEANQKANETPGKVIATHPEHGIVGALTFSHTEWNKPGQGRGVDVVMVDPAHRGPELRQGGKSPDRGGVAGAMYNIASREMGYSLGHSRSLSNKGAKFAQRVGGPTNTGLPPRANLGNSIGSGLTPGSLNTSLLKNDLANNSTPIDPVIGRALTPTGAKPSRQRKPVQDQIPGHDWSQHDPAPKKKLSAAEKKQISKDYRAGLKK